jgi:feruloyl-CoA synthase
MDIRRNLVRDRPNIHSIVANLPELSIDAYNRYSNQYRNMKNQEHKYRPFTFGITEALTVQGEGGLYVRAAEALREYPTRLTDKLIEWAERKPNQALYARRNPRNNDQWDTLTFSQALQAARGIGQALIDQGLSADRPLVILSENSLEHAMLALGAMYVGIPFCAVSPPYSLVSQDFDKLRHVIQTLTPGLVYASDWTRYGRAIQAVLTQETPVVLNETANVTWAKAFDFSTLRTTPVTAQVERAMLATGPDTLVKFLFTSGSTKLPKAVINTQRMLCANQQQMLQSMPAIGLDPLVLVDWMPWNHTAGGNHNFFMVLFNGGTLYIDDGKPTAALGGETLRNLREVAPTWYFNVPIGFEMIVNAMQDDPQLRRNFLSRVHQLYYAGAGLAQPIWDKLYAAAQAEFGERIVMTAGLGMTESCPFALFVTTPHSQAGDIGLPAAGLELKLVPSDDKCEIRYRGPNITPGYWRNPEETQASFDEEGFFCTGDAVRWIDETNPHLGLRFDGRIAEDFKLTTGTFVSVGPLRSKIIALGAPYVQDAVITGLNKRELGAMLIPTPALRKLAEVSADADLKDVVASQGVQAWLGALVSSLFSSGTGSANRIARALILTEPASIDKGEVTDKGSINQRAMLKHRDYLVEALHDGSAPSMVIASS